MADQRRGKRKSPCSEFISEVNELDLSPEHPDGETDEPDSKIAKTDTNISVVTTVTISSNSISNLDQDSEANKLDTKVEIDRHCVDGSSNKVNNENPASSEEIKPSITIQFRNQEVADIYKSKFLRFMESFVELELVKSENPLTLLANRDELLNDKEWVIIDEIPESQEILTVEPKEEIKLSPKKRKKKNKNKKEPKDLFVVDTNPSLRVQETELRYSSKFVIEDKAVTKANEEIRVTNTQICFNCGQNHSLRDCPMPKDYVKIRNARAKFMNAQNKTTRYHLEEDQKYGHMKPGKISDELRKALGLRGHELPPYIYKMRILGYPPGWLEEARFVHSNLDMFDIHGNNVRNFLKKKQGLDPEKIVNYPGFNVPPEKGSRDDYKRYDVPPYSRKFSKEAMLNYFEKEFAKEQDDFEACDMDVDDENDDRAGNVVTIHDEPLADVITIDDDHSESVIMVEDDSEEKDSKYNIQPKRLAMKSPSLVDLEQKKKDLLAQLEDNTNSKPGTPSTVSTDEPIITAEKISENSASEIVSDEHSESTCENEVPNLSENSNPLNDTPVDISFNSVKQTSFGTPILKSSSPYSRLPNPDNFMKDVSPVINFENLPNSTGKYEQMSGIIQKVRNTLKKLQGCKT